MVKPFLFLLVCGGGIILAQPISDARASWISVSSNFIAAAARLPEADYSYRPTPEVRTFAQLVGHVADSHYMFCAPMLPQAQARSGFEKLTSKNELLTALKASVDFCSNAADRIASAEDAAAPVKFFGRDIAKVTLLWTNISHTNEHYGNAVTYLRLKNLTPPSSETPAMRSRIYYDRAHGQNSPSAGLAEIGARAGFVATVQEQPIKLETLRAARLLYLRAPSKELTRPETDAVVEFVKGGGSLLLVVDEEQRQPLATTGVNEIIEPFGLKLTADTTYVHNCGAIAKAGEIHRADREVPFSGGRAVEGGTPFAWQLDKEGKPAQAFAAWKKVENGGGRIVVMAEGMASLFLGEPNAERLSGIPRNFQGTKYWGKDSAIFMEEVTAWLLKKN
jgi:uncharacterized damage-inducible protein DinB